LPIIIRSFSEPQLKFSKFEHLFQEKENIKTEDPSSQKDGAKTSDQTKTKETKSLKEKNEATNISTIKSPKEQKDTKPTKQIDNAITRKSTLKPKGSIEVVNPNEEKRSRTSTTYGKKETKEKEESHNLNPKESTSAPNLMEKPLTKKQDDDSVNTSMSEKLKTEEEKITKTDKISEKPASSEESKEAVSIEENKQDDLIIKWCSICDLIVSISYSVINFLA
jgi:hypothetical protein